MQSGKLTKGDRLGQTDHSQINYPDFRRCFYIEVPELARMTQEEVDEYRKELDDLKVIHTMKCCMLILFHCDII